MRRSKAEERASAAARVADDVEAQAQIRRPTRSAGRAAPREVARIPHDVVNEQVLIAAAILDPEACARLVTIPADHFYGKGHGEIWEAMRELERRGLAYDPATLQQLSGGKLDEGYLAELIQARPEAPPNLSYHVDCLHWDRARVEGVRGPLAKLVEGLQDVTAEPERIKALARQVGVAFGGAGKLRYLRDPQQLIREQAAVIRARHEGVACYPFGIDGLDVYPLDEPSLDSRGRSRAGRARMIPGAAPKKTTVVTGCPGGGKTTIVAKICLEQANMGRRVLVGAWEQGSGPTLELCAAISLGLSRSDLMEGLLDEASEAELLVEMERLAEHLRFFELPLPADRTGKAFNDRVLDIIHEHVVASGAEVFVADLWRRAVRQFDPDEEEVALYRQQGIAFETSCHNLLVHQQRLKDVETRKDKRPTRESIKGSATWVEMPDTILGVHRQALWKDVDDTVIEIDVLKQRNGIWPMAIECDYDADTGQIANGRSVAYMRSEEVAVDEFLDGPAQKGGRRRTREAN